jgi:hypothetical protein
MANSGTLINTISMIKARIAMAVDDCIGRSAPSKQAESPPSGCAAVPVKTGLATRDAFRGGELSG